ncbi:MAG: CZB domain-containing protein [Gammaproteobacteria bacterium]|nr:CZB domain-containing protein [Gammaproteobacteria bacterium]
MSVSDELRQAIAAHGLWKQKFRDFMAGTLDLDASVVQQNNQCQFGKWLESQGHKRLNNLDFSEIDQLHTEFHKVAAEVIRKKKAGQTQVAEQSLAAGGVFAAASAKLTSRLMAVKG